MTEIPLTGQNFVSAFDNRNGQLYFNILAKKTHEMDFDVFITNTEQCIKLKMAQESSQSDTYNSRYSQNTKGVKAVKLFLFYTCLDFIFCTSYSL